VAKKKRSSDNPEYHVDWAILTSPNVPDSRRIPALHAVLIDRIDEPHFADFIVRNLEEPSSQDWFVAVLESVEVMIANNVDWGALRERLIAAVKTHLLKYTHEYTPIAVTLLRVFSWLVGPLGAFTLSYTVPFADRNRLFVFRMMARSLSPNHSNTYVLTTELDPVPLERLLQEELQRLMDLKPLYSTAVVFDFVLEATRIDLMLAVLAVLGAIDWIPLEDLDEILDTHGIHFRFRLKEVLARVERRLLPNVPPTLVDAIRTVAGTSWAKLWCRDRIQFEG